MHFGDRNDRDDSMLESIAGAPSFTGITKSLDMYTTYHLLG